nr:hypothetical protein F56F4.1 - Caenorhabditis elegans [Caenorhabditis elegans]
MWHTNKSYVDQYNFTHFVFCDDEGGDAFARDVFSDPSGAFEIAGYIDWSKYSKIDVRLYIWHNCFEKPYEQSDPCKNWFEFKVPNIFINDGTLAQKKWELGEVKLHFPTLWLIDIHYQNNIVNIFSRKKHFYIVLRTRAESENGLELMATYFAGNLIFPITACGLFMMGVACWMIMQHMSLNKIYSQNEMIQKLLNEKNNSRIKNITLEQTMELPEDNLKDESIGSHNKISRAPLGPVPMEQTYLTFTCHSTGLYVKAVVDEMHTVIDIMTYEKDDCFKWTETTCLKCIEKVRCVLADGKCPVPFALDIFVTEADIEHSDSESEAIDQQGTVVNVELESEEEKTIITAGELNSDSDSVAINQEINYEFSVELSTSSGENQYLESDSKVIEEKIQCKPLALEVFDFSCLDYEYDYSDWISFVEKSVVFGFYVSSDNYL